MSRRTIGICVSGYNLQFEYKVIQGVYEKCQENDCNLLIFSSFMPHEDVKMPTGDMLNIIRGESEIYNLINYEMIDGLIIFGSVLPTSEVFENIEKKCKEYNVPLVDVGDLLHTAEHNIVIRNEASMELIVEHLITEHGFTKINYIGGIPDNKESEERLAAYKKVLTKHKIPVEEKRIGYGYFWKQAESCVKDFLKNNEVPEAIVCANDSMAIFAMDYLKNNGYSIPDDVVVTGFDGTPDADNYSPSITTIRPDYLDAGYKTFSLINDAIDGKKCEDLSVEATLCLQESCGCKKVFTEEDVVVYDYLKDTYGVRHDFMQFSTDISNMNLIFGKADNSYTLFDGLLAGLNVLKFKRLFMAICADLEREKEIFYTEKSDFDHYGISANMVSVSKYGHDVPVGTFFNSSELLPIDFLNEEKPCLMFFAPMYFKDKFLGYTAFEPFSLQFYPDLFLVWLQIASNDVGSFYVKNELENMYVRDPLTGLYNRRGLKKMFAKTFTEAQDCKKGYLTVYCADIDYLKAINDMYGHEAGDNAIVRCADALRLSLPKKTVCVRTGGDEYMMLSYTKKLPEIQKYIEEINKYLDNYNEKSNVPYLIRCSCAYCSESVEGKLDLEKMIRTADKNLLKIKANRDTVKNDIIRKFND